jgi:type IV pilus assembly protein PilV
MRGAAQIPVHTMRAAHAEAGFTLAEVLVALFVVALGIAGAAGVQAMALRAGREAARMADGVQLAATLAERMRANPAAMALADDVNPYLQVDDDAGSPPTVACFGGSGDSGDSGCGAAELARFDRAEVGRELALRFPGGRILACRDASAPDASGLSSWSCDNRSGAPVVVKLGWREPGETAVVPRVLLPVAGSGA